MSLNRRQFAIALGTLPFLPRPASALTVAKIPRLELEGVRVLSVSPDGTRLAGTDSDGALGIWDVESLESLALVPETPEIKRLDFRSIAWHPDGESFAFSIYAFQMMLAGRIYQVTAGSDELEFLTGEPNADLRLEIGDDMEIDTWPCWSQDGAELHFVRSISALELQSTRIMTRFAETGDIQEFALVDTENLGAIMDPMWRYRDSSIAFNHTGLEPKSELRIATGDGKTAPLVSELFPLMERTATVFTVNGYGAEGTRVSITRMNSAVENEFWVVDLNGDPMWTRVADLDPAQLAAAPALHPHDGRLALVGASTGEVKVIVGEAGATLGRIFELSELIKQEAVLCFWGGDSIFVTAGDQIWRAKTSA